MKIGNAKKPDHRGWINMFLHDLGVRTLEARLSGSGDSGDLDEITYSGENNTLLSELDIQRDLQDVRPPFSDSRRGLSSAYDYLVDIVVSDANAAGNWYDNEGGAVESRYNVTKEGLETDYVDLTHFEPDYDDDEYDEDEDDIFDGLQP